MGMNDIIIRAILGATLGGLLATAIALARVYARVLILQSKQHEERLRSRAHYREIVERMKSFEDRHVQAEWKLKKLGAAA